MKSKQSRLSNQSMRIFSLVSLSPHTAALSHAASCLLLSLSMISWIFNSGDRSRGFFVSELTDDPRDHASRDLQQESSDALMAYAVCS